MNAAMTRKSCLPLLILGLLLPVLPAQLGAEDWVVGGETYREVRVWRTTPATVTIFHAGGIRQLELAALPPQLQARFGFDPGTAEAFGEQETRRREAEAAELAAREDERRRRERAEAARPVGEPRILPPERVQYLPEQDLRPIYRERGLFAKNQGRRPSCSVFAITSALEYERARRDPAAARLSEEFLVWATLQLQPGIALDTGFNFPEVITALQTFGIPPLDLMPNTIGRPVEDIRPTEAAVAAARELRAVVPVWFRRDDPYLIARIVGVLNEEKPVIVAVRWPHWRTLHNNFRLRNQVPLEDAAHAVTLVGYRNSGGTADGTTFIFRNSYGNGWGNAGYGFIDATYLREQLVGAFYLRLP
jgi:hypothetical protein